MINLSTLTVAFILLLGGARTFAQNNKLITDRLTSEIQISVDQKLVSANKAYTCIFQSDGNIVVYNNSHKSIWASGTNGKRVDLRNFQNDGNLVLYNQLKPVWYSQGGGKNPPYHLIMQNDGNLVIYDKNFQPFWSSYGGSVGLPSSRPNTAGNGCPPGWEKCNGTCYDPKVNVCCYSYDNRGTRYYLCEGNCNTSRICTDLGEEKK